MEKGEHISFKVAEEFIEGKLGEDKLPEVEEHISKCDECRRKINSLRKFTSVWNGWTDRAHGEAYRKTSEKKRSAICDTVLKNLKIIVPEDELARKRIEKKAPGYLKRIRAWIETKAQEKNDGDGIVLVAATPEEHGNSGKALGVAVDEKTGDVFIINISAWVGEQIEDAGELSVVGSQVEGRAKNGIEYKLTAPLTLLRKKLSIRFKTVPWLASLNLHRRDVHVEIDNPQFLDKAESLLLAVIAAIVKAATGRSGHDNLVYSADVDLQGNLTRVGRIEDKADFVISAGNYRLVLSSANHIQIRPHMRIEHPGRFIAYSTIGELFDFFQIKVSKPLPVKPTETDEVQEPGKRKFFDRIRASILILVLAAVCIGGFMYYTGEDFFTPIKTFRSFVAGLVNDPVKQFKDLSASHKLSDLEEAVKVGLKIRPDDPFFRESFIGMAAILMDRVNNTDYARQALSNYVEYTRLIQNRPDARQSIADTIDSARDLMNRYAMKNTFHQEQKFGGHVESLLLQYELKR